MRFVPVAAAKMKVGDQVFTLNEAGEYNVGKLHSRQETTKGLKLEFEVPQYQQEGTPPPLKPVLVSDITHVCSMKNRKPVTDDSQE